jgi:hypothetical protein
MRRRLGLYSLCAAAALLAASAAALAGDPPPLTARAKAPRAAAPARTSPPPAYLTDPTILTPKGLSSDDLPQNGGDFLQRTLATKRLELVRFVDREDRRVFLGVSRDGYLGIQVQKRDR